MGQTVELVEYQTKRVASVKPTPEDLRLADRLAAGGEIDARLDVRWLLGGHVEIKSSSWVGVVRFSGLEVRVMPKLVGGSLRVLRMVEYASGVRLLSRLPHDQRIPAEGTDLFHLIVMALVKETNSLVRDGLIRDYRPVDDALTVLRGRLRMRDQFLRRYGSLHQLECHFDEYDGDIPENQLLALALSAAAKRVDGSLLSNTRGLAGTLARTCMPPTRDPDWYTRQIQYDRRNGRYRPAHELALLVLKGLALSDLPGSTYQRVTAFMIDMNTVFERFVTRLVTEALADGPLHVSTQQTYRAAIIDESTRDAYATIRPDLVIVDGRSRQKVPVDIKYKLYEDKRLSSSDIYQLFTYAYALGETQSIPNAGVLYAATNPVVGPVLRINQIAGVSGASIRGAGVDVAGILAELDSETSSSVLDGVRNIIHQITGLPVDNGTRDRLSEGEFLSN